MDSKDESVIPVLNSMDQSEHPPLFVKLSFDKRELTQAKMGTLAVPVCLALYVWVIWGVCMKEM
ncbi:hypothetical protein Patl1_14736 [Pistacia atlantica]|uniref:Uncharacterized protein n=1 Tax=Pistacia atlantica TaxID=434234 RepID=A0ACC1AU49_9ROSI|nr:hypothetical protein Patl1_14736 [Pistacia atlantica]